MIKFLDLQKVNLRHEKAFQQKLQRTLEKGWYILGDEVERFELSFAEHCGAGHCIGVGNGLDALVLIFRAYIELGKLAPGDEVIVPANTFVASILAVRHAGLQPVLVEPSLDTFNLDPKTVEQTITTKTKAILAVDLYGLAADFESLSRIAEKHALLLIEDAAQAHGATTTLDGKTLFAGNLADATAFSFYPGKNLGALGDAGAVTTNDLTLAKMITSLRNYGSQQKYRHEHQGVNSRLDELQASFLNVKLPFLDDDNRHRRRMASIYCENITNSKVHLPAKHDGHVHHLFVIRCNDRDALQHHLRESGIETMIHYPIPPHRQKAFPDWEHLSFPITEKIHNEVLSLPMSPVLTMDEAGIVAAAINKF